MDPYADWTDEQEASAQEYADKAGCLRTLHEFAYNHYRRWNMWFAIPSICLSTVAAVLAFTARSYPTASDALMLATGCGGIIVAMMGSIATYLKLAENQEGNRVAHLQWGKFSRNVKLVLAMQRESRPRAKEYLDHIKEEMDRLSETSPIVPPEVVALFHLKIEIPDGMAIPEILGKLQPAIIARPHVVRENAMCQTDDVEAGTMPLVQELPPSSSATPTNDGNMTPASLVKQIKSKVDSRWK